MDENNQDLNKLENELAELEKEAGSETTEQPTTLPVDDPAPFQPSSENPQVPEPEPEKKKGGMVLGIGMVLLVLSFIAAGAYLLGILSKKEPKPASTPAPTQEATASPTDTPPPDPMADWETYNNNIGDYSFKYPGTWIIDDSEANKVVGGKLVVMKDKHVITVWSDLDGMGGRGRDVPTEPITISGLSLYKQFGSLNTFDGTKSVAISDTLKGNGFFEVEGRIYSISLSYPSEQEGTAGLNQTVAEFDQILSTFRFLKAMSSPDPASSPGGLMVGQVCGGLVGTPCPGGYTCQLEDDSSGSGGVCVKNSL